MKKYFTLANMLGDSFIDKYDGIIENGKVQIVSEGKNSFDILAMYGYFEAMRYEITKNEKYARLAVKYLCGIGELTKFYFETTPEKTEKTDIVLSLLRPKGSMMDSMFRPTYYLYAYYKLKNWGFISKKAKELCYIGAKTAMTPNLSYTDWGPHNRGMIKGFNLRLFASCFPEDNESAHWDRLGRFVLAENENQWSIEDAQIYIPIWMNAKIMYYEIFGNDYSKMMCEDFYKHPSTVYYFQYMRELMAVGGYIPEFGDARWTASSLQYICCLEKGASVYQDGKMKWAAERIFDSVLSWMEIDIGDNETEIDKIGGNFVNLINACRWEDPNLAPIEICFESKEILDEIIGKKYALCKGNRKDANYLFVNYRDEGMYAHLSRHFLRESVTVRQEKTHHGQSDENSIILLTSGETVLLHDSGYRDSIEKCSQMTIGNYRADFYHNRLVARKGLLDERANFLEFCVDIGLYRKVQTEKIFFKTLTYADAARTRIYDQIDGLDTDRTITFLKNEGIYVVHDMVFINKSGAYSFGTVYYTGEITMQDENSFVGRYEYIASDEQHKLFKNKGDKSLKIIFPEGGQQKTGTMKIRRSYADETGIFASKTGYFEKGEVLNIYSVLIPVQQNDSSISAEVYINGSDSSYFRVQTSIGTHTICTKNRLDYGITDFDKRPNYDVEACNLTYGDIETDAIYSHTFGASGKTHFSVINATGFSYKSKKQMDIPKSNFMQFDLSVTPSTPYWNIWEDYVEEDTL